MNKRSNDITPAEGCGLPLMWLCWIFAGLCALFGALPIAIFFLCMGVAGMFMITMMYVIFDGEPAPRCQKENVAYHREVHASEIVYYPPSYRPTSFQPRRPMDLAPAKQPETHQQRDARLGLDGCRDLVTGRVLTASEIDELEKKLNRVGFRAV